jgi:hypothetical protein
MSENDFSGSIPSEIGLLGALGKRCCIVDDCCVDADANADETSPVNPRFCSPRSFFSLECFFSIKWYSTE